MALRYRVVVLILILALMPAFVIGGYSWTGFWLIELILGGGISAIWLLISWVATGSSGVRRGI